MNGIDVSDLTRNFTTQEWEALGASNQSLILQMRNHTNNPNTRGRGCGQGQEHNNNTQNTSANVSAVTFEGDAPEQNSNQSEGSCSEHGGRNGRGFGHGVYGSQQSSGLLGPLVTLLLLVLPTLVSCYKRCKTAVQQ